MPFDGQDLPGVVSPIGRVGHHPGAHAIGEVLQLALRAGYTYARSHSRVIGIQTYREAFDFDDRSLRQYTAPAPGTYATISQCRARIPAHATHLETELLFTTQMAEPAEVFLLTRVVHGGTDDGAPISITVDPELVRGWGAYDREVGRLVSSYQIGFGLPATIYIQARAYAVSDGAGVPLRPALVITRWRSITP